jgi:hypothetical protein
MSNMCCTEENFKAYPYEDLEATANTVLEVKLQLAVIFWKEKVDEVMDP